ncbi:MAG: FG-GAP-like repeat-containing protein [Desulfococcaceae bacterium]|nr:FG-GAP-like repeat-containing protein [Desulfococcaceae bacterium]
MKKTDYKKILITLLLCTGFFAEIPETAAEESYTVLILPFQIHSENDLDFLKNGIQDMLTTRLSRDGKMRPLDRETVRRAAENLTEINEKTAYAAARQYPADYAVFGSLTVFGDSISTDARLLDVSQNKTLLTFNESGRSNGDVISHIDRFAAAVHDELFGSPKVAKPLPKKEETVADESRKHPDTLWTGRIEAEGKSPAGRGQEAGRLGDVWKSRNFKTAIIGLSAGDTDNDGNQEVVFIDEKNVHVYRQMKEGFIKIAEIEGEVNDSLLSVDAADINGNGKAEIFVSNLNRDSRVLRSFVLEWDGNRFQKIVSDIRSYFRVIDVPGRGPLLMSQQRGVNKIFLPGIDELNWDGARYTPASPQMLPRKVNVFAFNYGDVIHNGREEILSFDEETYLSLSDPEGKEDWKSPEPFGGSALYIEYPMEASSSIGSHKEQDHYYLPQRILIADADNDGRNEVLVNRGKDMARRLFARLRLFKGGQIHCLAWDDFGLYPKWMTRQISGYISDYALADIDNDGQKELLFSVVNKMDSVLGDARSYIAAQEILPSP